jgi:hypothetical protein
MANETDDFAPARAFIDPGDDEQPTEPPKAPVPATEARKQVTAPQELVDNPNVFGGEPGAATLSGFLTFYPFTRLFCAIAHRQFPSSHRPETRVARLREHHPKFYGLCIAMDVLVVFACTVILLGAASVALYKTLS